VRLCLEERDVIPEIMPYVKIKFPTADSDRGLGTGEFDETIGVDLSKRGLHRRPCANIRGNKGDSYRSAPKPAL
jgi:hypothetical protein